MQHIDIESAKAAKATDRRALAVLAFENACADPDFSNWRAVAELLRLAIPATKAKATAEAVATDSPFAPWSDQIIPQRTSSAKMGKSPVLVVTFADGETVRCPAVTMPGKPVNVGRGLRVAFAFYRARIAMKAAKALSDDSDCVAVPDMLAVKCETNGTEYDPAECNANTMAQRSGAFALASVTSDAAARGLSATADDGSLTTGDYIEAQYRLAAARFRLANMTDNDKAKALASAIEAYELRLTGMSPLQIAVKQHDDAKAARAAAAKADQPPPPPPKFKPAARFLNSSHLSMVHGGPIPVVPPVHILRAG